MLYSEIIAVCYEINKTHKYSTYRAVNTLRLSYTNQSVNAVQWNNSCLFWDLHKTHKYSPYRAVNTHRLSYTNQSVNAVQWNNRCLFWNPHKTHKYIGKGKVLPITGHEGPEGE
jgi:uncharacterized protein YktA (UPF0223 family)